MLGWGGCGGGLTGSRRRCQVMIRSHGCLKSGCFVVVTVTLGERCSRGCLWTVGTLRFARTSLSPAGRFPRARLTAHACQNAGKSDAIDTFSFKIARLHSRVLITIHAL